MHMRGLSLTIIAFTHRAKNKGVMRVMDHKIWLNYWLGSWFESVHLGLKSFVQQEHHLEFQKFTLNRLLKHRVQARPPKRIF